MGDHVNNYKVNSLTYDHVNHSKVNSVTYIMLNIMK